MKKLYVIIVLTIVTDPSLAQGNRIWSTYYGGPANEVSPSGGPFVATDNTGNVLLAGYTLSSSSIAVGGFPSTLSISSGGFQNYIGGLNDAFLVKFNSSGNRIWASYYGGPGVDAASGCALDGSGNIYISGATGSTNSIASGGFQNTYGGSND